MCFPHGPQGKHLRGILAAESCPHAEQKGFCPGWSLDLSTTNAAGRPWDFNLPECLVEAKRLVLEKRPLLLIGSPMCTWFSQLQNLNQKH